MAKKKNPFMHGGEWVTNAQGSRFILRGRHRVAMALSKHILFDDEYDMQYACDYEPVADLFPYPVTSNEVIDEWSESAKQRLATLDEHDPAQQQEIQIILEVWSDVWRDEAWQARGKCPGCYLPYGECECASQEIGIIKHRSGAPARAVVLAEDDDLPF